MSGFPMKRVGGTICFLGGAEKKFAHFRRDSAPLEFFSVPIFFSAPAKIDPGHATGFRLNSNNSYPLSNAFIF